MKQPPQPLTRDRVIQLIQKMRSSRVAVVGDIMLDRYLIGETERLSPEDAVRLLRRAGGVPVFAHPGLADRDALIPALVEAGLMGIECYYSEHSPAQRGAYVDLCRRYGLVATGGSDFHGPSVRAGSLGDLLAEAGRALAEVELIKADCVPGGPVRTIRVTSSDREALLVDWLNELIFLADFDRWVALDFSINLAEETEVRAGASGVTLEWGLSRVKAATFHRLRVEDVPGGLEANVILDV